MSRVLTSDLLEEEVHYLTVTSDGNGVKSCGAKIYDVVVQCIAVLVCYAIICCLSIAGNFCESNSKPHLQVCCCRNRVFICWQRQSVCKRERRLYYWSISMAIYHIHCTFLGCCNTWNLCCIIEKFGWSQKFVLLSSKKFKIVRFQTVGDMCSFLNVEFEEKCMETN